MPNSEPDEKSIFNAALEIDSQEARREYVRRRCGDNVAQFDRVTALLQGFEKDSQFLELQTVDLLSPDTGSPAIERPEEQIGPYKICEKIGEGGMGTVWMAQQEQPVRRQVALKLVRGEVGSKEVIARFEAERQALAMMDHNNIAKVLDAGTTDAGDPYFVMELVKGIPITKYCDENKLSIAERLQLMVSVCKAVQHAHQKGIIHRDLKPSNVLVTLSDGEPVPKVIDFGLAKALDAQTKLTDKTMFTQIGQVVGTVQYMSPEQAGMNELDVDTRTDIYSLGVMLYELLTGSTPLDKETLAQNVLLKVLEIIREADPPRPSDRLSSTGDAITGISQQRKIAPSKLQQILRGELDWVVMKALEKDRTRRYDTASSFAEDIENYLCGNAVEARPPSAAYRLRKVVRKHKVAFASGSIFVLLLLFGLIGTGGMWLRAQEQAERASRAEIETRHALNEARVQQLAAIAEAGKARAAEDKERVAREKMEAEKVRAEAMAEQAQRDRVRAELEAKTANQVSEFLTGLFRSSDPLALFGAGAGFRGREETPADLTVREVIDRATELLEEELLDQPAVRAKLLNTLASVYAGLGLADIAEPLIMEALKIRQGIHHGDHPEVAESLNRLGEVRLLQTDFQVSTFRVLDEALQMRRRLASGKDDLAVAMSLLNLSYAHHFGGGPRLKLAEGEADKIAEDLARESLAIRRRLLPKEDYEIGTAMMMLGACMFKTQGKMAAGLVTMQASRIMRKHEGENGLGAVLQQTIRAEFLRSQREYDRAAAVEENYIALAKSILGPSHPWVHTFYDRHFATLRGIDEDTTIKAMQERIAFLEDYAASPVDRWWLGNHYSSLVFALRRAGRRAEAVDLSDKFTKIRESLVAEFPDNLQYQSNLVSSYFAHASLLDEAGRAAEGIEAIRKVIEISERRVSKFPDEIELRSSLAGAYAQLGSLLSNAGREKEAIGVFRHLIELQKNLVVLGDRSAVYEQANSNFQLGNALFATGDFAGAEILYKNAIAQIDREISDQPPDEDNYNRDLRSEFYKKLSESYAEQARFLESISALDHSVETVRGLASEFPDSSHFERRLAWLLYQRALTHLISNDLRGYRADCKTLIERFKDSSIKPIAVYTLMSCSLSPVSIENLSSVFDVLQQDDQLATDPDLLEAFGAALYRVRRYEEAIKTLEDVERLESKAWTVNTCPYYCYFLAMAHHQLERTDRAKVWLQKGIAWTEQNGSTLSWHERETLKLLRREAEDLIHNTPAADEVSQP